MKQTAASERLASYWSKRDFSVTAEPRGTTAKPGKALSFVIQKHDASRLHYDFRLELDGVLLSWAVPKGPSFDPADKRLAVHVEDHPLSYGGFEGTIPPGQYGAGTVIVWDNGHWEPVGDPHKGLKEGKLLFNLQGQKLRGLWELVKIAKGGERQEPWLLFKKRDALARPRSEYDVVSALPDSVMTSKPLPASKRSASKPQPKTSTSALEVPGAKKSTLPATLSPQLATLATGVPADGEWVFEIKFDGYRILARIDAKGKATLFTRNGHDWSARMPTLVRELETLGVRSAWLDGEIVVLGAHGSPDFNALQRAFEHPSKGGGAELMFFLFDAPFFMGHDLREVELRHRRALLKALLDEHATAHVRFSEDFGADAATILESACQMNLEGVIAKRADAGYVSRRSESWLKLKCKLRQEFVVCGYTDRSDGSAQVGSLLLGVYGEDGALMSVGSVGTGWSFEEAGELQRKLAPLDASDPPFASGTAPKPGRWTRRTAGSEHWVKPRLVAEIEFAEWTPDGQIRHASYVALRSDKPPKAITREKAKMITGQTSAPKASRTSASKAVPAKGAVTSSVKVTHGERVIDTSTGLTKLDLVRYYDSVAAWMLPHLQGRPVSLVRGPRGIEGQLFYQRHAEEDSIPGLKELDESLWKGHPSLIEVPSVRALASAAQMNVIEFHTWNARGKAIDTPDRMVFDLDPGEGAPWAHVQEAATLVRALLAELKLEAWLKTSGGKGLHVVVPLTPKWDFDTVKAFSQAVVQHLASTIPSRFVAKSGPKNRVGKVFADYLRNGLGATTACAFSARARPGLGVSMPVAWEELPKLKSGAQWTIATAREYLSFQREDPWAGYWKKRQTLTAGMKALGFEPAPVNPSAKAG